MRALGFFIFLMVLVHSTYALDKVTPTATTWDTGDSEGWSAHDGGAATFPLTGGVTGGFMQIEDTTSGWMYILAPSEYLGDYTDMDNVGFFSVGVRTLIQGERVEAPFATLTLSGPGGTYSIDMGD